jgi:exodeoxyribonuclease V alpha subunit
MLLSLDRISADEDDELQMDIDIAGSLKEMSLDEKQIEAIKSAAKRGVSVLTGGPGTGKTTAINGMIRFLTGRGEDVLLAAPTGRAAKRMTEATGYEAKTIHRMLEVHGIADDSEDGAERISDGMFERNNDNPLEADVVIIDEMSMVDISLFYALLSAIPEGTRLVLVGDINQLPSVGPGNVLKDVINSDCFTVTRLEKIFRQATESDIVMNAHKINRGEEIELGNKSQDFFFLERKDPTYVMAAVWKLVAEKLPKYVGASVSDIQVMAPMKKGSLGTIKLNDDLQMALNPPAKDKEQYEFLDGHIFRVGDKVMQTRNDYKAEWEIRGKYGIPKEKGLGVFNGDTGVITEINDSLKTISVMFDENKIVEYPYSDLDELELAYAITIHKSQGSEYPAVIIPLLGGPRMLLNRNLFYTAVTRAKKCVVLVGSKDAFISMINNEDTRIRYSGLKDKIIGRKKLLENM